jgi:hypothetical protein
MTRFASVVLALSLWFGVGLSARQSAQSSLHASLTREATRLASTLANDDSFRNSSIGFNTPPQTAPSDDWDAVQRLKDGTGVLVTTRQYTPVPPPITLSERTPGGMALAVAQAASGGGVPARPRVSAERLLGGQPVTDSFEALQPLLGSGYEVVVTDDSGRVRRGKVVSVSGDQLVMSSPVAAGTWEALLPIYWAVDVGVVVKRQIFRSGDRVFAGGSVRRIDIVDSTWNGTAIGAAVGAGLVAGVYQWERRQPESSQKGLWTALAVVLGFPTSLRIGHVLDRAINEPIYERPSRRARISVSPWLGRDVKGVIAQARF